MRTRILLGATGTALAAYGAWRLLTLQRAGQSLALARWLAGAVIIHDGVLAPALLGAGALTALVRPRARRYLQGSLVAGALVTAITIPLVYRRGTQVPAKALERQDYPAHLALLLALIATGGVLAYLVRVVRDRRAQRTSAANVRPSPDQTSSST